MKNIYLTFIIITAIFLSGCGHTNELAKYNLSGQGFMFTNYVNAEAKTIQVTTEKSYNGNKKKNDIISVLTEIGSNIVTADVKNKLQNSISTDTLNSYISSGLEKALVTYLNINPVGSLKDDPQFIVETDLNKCELVSTKRGVFVRVNAESRIIDRHSGKIIWVNSESESAPVGNNGYSEDGNTDPNMNKAINAIQLAALSKEEIQNVINQAAITAGKMMGDTLREDVAESKEKPY